MHRLDIAQSPAVRQKFASYPAQAAATLDHLRQLILDTAAALPGIDTVEETLKWGEPSYQVTGGSPIRIDWKERSPEQYAMYFSCSTSLVSTFREVYGDTFTYEKNRALLFRLDTPLPEAALRECIALALTYHSVKHLPFLGKL